MTDERLIMAIGRLERALTRAEKAAGGAGYGRADPVGIGETGTVLQLAVPLRPVRHDIGRIVNPTLVDGQVVGGVIPPDDYEALKTAGATAIFPPGTVIPEAAERLLDRLLQRTS